MRLVRAALFVAATGACAGAPRRVAVMPAPATREPLRIAVIYPDTADVIQSHDSTFLFGNVGVGRGDAALSINGQPIPVQANGAWIAWLPLPDDTIARFQIVARAGVGAEQGETTFVARIAPHFRPPINAVAWIDTTSFDPGDSVVFPAGEGIRLSVRATPGARVRLRIEGHGSIPFAPDTLPDEPAWGVRAFGTDTAAYRLPPARDRYVAWLPAQLVCDAIVEVIVGSDTARAVWPLFVDTLRRAQLPVVVLNDDTAHTGKTDSLTVGKAVPYGTYNCSFRWGRRPLRPASGAARRGCSSRGTSSPG